MNLVAQFIVLYLDFSLITLFISFACIVVLSHIEDETTLI